MYNYYREDWLVDRYASTLDEVFGQPPCVEPLRRRSASSVLVGVRRRRGARLPGRRRLWHRDRPTPGAGRPTTTRSPTCATRTIPASTCVTLALILLRRRCSLIRADRRAAAADASATPTCSSWARRSCCSRRRASCSSPCCSARRGSSTRSCSWACCSACWSRWPCRSASRSGARRGSTCVLLAALVAGLRRPAGRAARRWPSCRGSCAAVDARVPPDLHRQPGLRPAVQATSAPRRRPSAPTCSAPWSAACSSTPR